MIIGLILVIIGIVFLLQNLGCISGGTWSIIWPAILIVIGLGLILKTRDHGFFWEEKFGWGKGKTKTRGRPKKNNYIKGRGKNQD